MTPLATGFETYLKWVMRRAGWTPEITVVESATEPLFVKYGSSDTRRVLFLFFPEGLPHARLHFRPGFFRTGRLTDILTDTRHVIPGDLTDATELSLACPTWRLAVLVEE